LALPVLALKEFQLVAQFVVVPLSLSEVVYLLLQRLHKHLLMLSAGGLAIWNIL
jgi:hypothetical protein